MSGLPSEATVRCAKFKSRSPCKLLKVTLGALYVRRRGTVEIREDSLFQTISDFRDGDLTMQWIMRCTMNLMQENSIVF